MASGATGWWWAERRGGGDGRVEWAALTRMCPSMVKQGMIVVVHVYGGDGACGCCCMPGGGWAWVRVGGAGDV